MANNDTPVVPGIKISQFPSLQGFTGKENFVVQEGFYNYKVDIETLRDHISKNEVFFCDFINEKTENVTDEQYDGLLAAINVRNIIMIGSNVYLRIINDIRVSEDILSLRASQSFDSGSALILTSIEYDISVESENGVHAVTVKSSSQSFDHSGDGTKFLNDAGEYSPIPSGGGVEIIKISAINPGWMFTYSIDVEENNKVINCMDNGIPFILQMWIGTSSNPYSYLYKYFFPIGWDVMGGRYVIYYNDLGLYESGDDRKNSIKLNLKLTFEKNKTERYNIGLSTNALIDLRYGGDGDNFLADDGTYKNISLMLKGTDFVTIKRRFSDAELRYYAQISLNDYNKLYEAIKNKSALAVVWIENNAIYAMTMLGKKSTYVENTSIHIECIAVQYTTGNAGGNNGYGFEPLYLTLERSNILPGSIIEGEMESEGQFMFLNSGDGNKYLADNGEYKEIASVRELYISAGAVYNEQTGFYELNGLTDITESQMRYIYTCCGGNPNSYDLNQKYEGFKIRTNIPFRCDIGNVNEGVNASRLCYLNSSLEVFKISTNNLAGYMTVLDGSDMFAACSKLTKIIGRFIFRPSTDAKNMFNSCRSLQELKIQNLYTDLFLGHSPLLSLQSFEYIIGFAKNTSPITIKVHADVYAKLQDESQTDWHALIETAAAKQITFATA